MELINYKLHQTAKTTHAASSLMSWYSLPLNSSYILSSAEEFSSSKLNNSSKCVEYQKSDH
ncbi:hypothetical protein T05_14122 [Trichinella murrelli]|uniref:Uncharacterized protein n=1 Tax=Trichinella murrelli TaxID=144512 RepID=A0A0V0TU65_9BILA|nr:hypothetical protein T05_14122 [Trichinella murrelli]